MDSTSRDPDEPAQVAANAGVAGSPTAGAALADATTTDAPAAGEPTDAAPADTSPTSEPGVDAMPVPPLAAAVTDGETSARPRRRRSLALRFGVAFVLGFLLAVSVSGGVLYAWGQQYEGRVLPGVRIGSTELGGLTREQAEAEIANAYGWLGYRADHAHRPGWPDDDHQLRRRRPRPRHDGAGRRGTRGGPPGRAHRRPHRCAQVRDPRRHPRPRRCLRPRQAGGGRRDVRRRDRPDARGRLCVGQPARDVQRLLGEGGSSR